MNIFAYIDPATTATILQICAGVVITLGVVFGIWWRKITTFFKGLWAKIFGKKLDETQVDETADEILDDEVSQQSDEEISQSDEKISQSDDEMGEKPSQE